MGGWGGEGGDFLGYNLKQNEAQSVRNISANKGVNQRSKDVTQTQQQRPESPTVALTWHASKHKVHKLHRYICTTGGVYVPCSTQTGGVYVPCSTHTGGVYVPCRTHTGGVYVPCSTHLYLWW